MIGKINIELEIGCSICGSTLIATFLGRDILIMPCQSCLDKKWDEGYNMCLIDKEELE